MRIRIIKSLQIDADEEEFGILMHGLELMESHSGNPQWIQEKSAVMRDEISDAADKLRKANSNL